MSKPAVKLSARLPSASMRIWRLPAAWRRVSMASFQKSAGTPSATSQRKPSMPTSAIQYFMASIMAARMSLLS